MTERKITLIAAIDSNNGIGKNGTLPWHEPADLRFFKRVTWGHTVIMGYTTFASFGCVPLPNRNNIVLTRQERAPVDGVTFVHSKQEALDAATGDVFVIGGAQVFELFEDVCTHSIITDIGGDFGCDTFINPDCIDGLVVTLDEIKTMDSLGLFKVEG